MAPIYSRARTSTRARPRPARRADGMSVPTDVRAPPERPPGPQFTIPTFSRQVPPVPMANGSPKTAPPPRRLEPIIVSSEPARPSRSLADWMMLAGMFIFLGIPSQGQMTTANELKKLNERMGPAQLGVSPATASPPPTAPPPMVSPPPYPVGVPFPPPNPAPFPPPPTAGSQPKYEYLVDTLGSTGTENYYFWSDEGTEEYADFLNNKSNSGWELIECHVYKTGHIALCTFRKIVS